MATSTEPSLLRQILNELEHRESAASSMLQALIERRLRAIPAEQAVGPERSTTSAQSTSGSQTPVAKVIAAARQKLLDLTRRNRLVHFGPGNPENGKPTSDSLVLMGNAGAAWNQIVNEERGRGGEWELQATDGFGPRRPWVHGLHPFERGGVLGQRPQHRIQTIANNCE